MNDRPTPEPLDDPPVVEAAFARLRDDVRAVSTDNARHRLDAAAGRRAPWGPMLVGAAALLLVALGVFALRGDDDPELATDPTPDETDIDDAVGPVSADLLDGTSWVLADLGFGPSGPVPLVEGWPITITFSGDTFSGTAACNGYGGRYTIEGDGRFVTAEIGSQEQACEDAVMASEAAFFAALDDVDQIAAGLDSSARDGLAFDGPSSSLVFVRTSGAPIERIVGRTWLLESLISGGVTTDALGEPATLRLEPDSTVIGGTGCRGLNGEWVVSGASILFPSFGADGECSPDLTDQDGLVVTVLGDGFTAEVDGEILRLSSVGGEGLVYRLLDAEVTDEPTAEPLDEPVSVDELVDGRPDTWVDVVGYLDDRGGGAYLCAQPVVDFCGARWVVVVGDITVEPSAEPVVLRGALDEWGRLVVDPSAVVGDPAPDAFEGFIGLPVDGAVSSALLAGDLTDPALRWHPDGVALTLGGTAVMVTRTPQEIVDPANWTIEADGFRAYTGPFSALEALTGAEQVMVNNGTHAHCAAPPMPLPDVSFDRQVVIQADGIDSCLQWFVVDVLLDGDDRIVAVNLDLWEP